MTTEKRLDILEKRVNAIFDIVNRDKFYTDADISGTRQGISNNSADIVQNIENISQNEDAVCELSETTEASLTELEQAICDLSEEMGNLVPQE